jgi:hypothetical protein
MKYSTIITMESGEGDTLMGEFSGASKFADRRTGG